MNWLLGVKWTVEFEDNKVVDRKVTYVILSNHQSTLDVMGMMQVGKGFFYQLAV